MFLFTAAANDTSRRADPVVDLDRGPYVPDPIGPSVILKAYNVYPLAHSDGVRLTLLSPVSHSSSWRNFDQNFIYCPVAKFGLQPSIGLHVPLRLSSMRFTPKFRKLNGFLWQPPARSASLTRPTTTKYGRARVKTLSKLIDVWVVGIDKCFIWTRDKGCTIFCNTRRFIRALWAVLVSFLVRIMRLALTITSL